LEEDKGEKGYPDFVQSSSSKGMKEEEEEAKAGSR
jgi:hypothetical protein